VFILILLMSIIFLCMYSGTVGHEEAHVQINKYFGMNSTYKINVGFDGISGVTTNDITDNYYSLEDGRAAYMVHGINEAIGYQLVPFFVGIMIFLLIIIMLLIINMDGGNSDGNNNNRRKTTEV